MRKLEQLKFELDENYFKPVFTSIPCSTNNRFKCMLDSGAGIPVWCANEEALLDAFPNAIYKESYRNLLGGFGAVFQAVKVYYVPKVEFSNGESSLIFEDFYLPVSPRRSFGIDLILPSVMIKESKIILSQIDIKHQGKTLEVYCSTRYLKAHYTLKHIFASDVKHYREWFARQKAELQKQEKLDINLHTILIGAEGEFSRVLTQEELERVRDPLTSEDSSVNAQNTQYQNTSTEISKMDVF